MKPYSCVVCGWRFHLLHNMQRHLATHKTQDKVPSQAEKLIISNQTFPLTPYFLLVLYIILIFILTQAKSKASEEEKASKKEKLEEAKE